MDPTYPTVPIVNFVAFVLVLIPLSTATVRRSWNIGLFAYASWIASVCFCTGINSILWSSNVKNIAPVWCDICKHYHTLRRLQILIGLTCPCICLASHIDFASSTAISASSFVITRRLYNIIYRQGRLQQGREVCFPLIFLSVFQMCINNYRSDSKHSWKSAYASSYLSM